MTSSGNDDRRFSDEEFALILRKAAELQEGGSKPPALRTGMSLEEIQSIAAEAGIDPDRVAQAASLLVRSDRPRMAVRLFGGPSSYHLEHTAKGEISQEDLGRMLDVIRKATKHQGQGTRVLDALEWKTQAETSQINVNVTPRDGETTIQIIADRSGTGALMTMVFTMPWVILAVIVGTQLDANSLAEVAGILAGAAGGAFVSFRTFWKTTTRRFRRKLAGLMEDLTDAVDDAVESAKKVPDGAKEPTSPDRR
ncbi:MAG: hypothetical protein GTO22_14250 [Gemmatimonadales bacterium]|nr:hypothetical protein [Gemmatimonadales bacterium]